MSLQRARLSGTWRAAFLFASGLSSAAQAVAIVPQQAQICGVDNHVDKAKLATFLLDSVPVSRKLEDWAQANPQGWEELSPRQRMIADETICAKADGKPPAQCASTDRDNLATARQALISLLRLQPQSFVNENKVNEPRGFFASPAVLRCVQSKPGSPVEATGAIADKFSLKFPLRVRGVADGIYFARTDAGFKAQEKATISFSRDFEKKKRTEKFAVVAGYPIELADTERRSTEIVPYAGISRDIAKVQGKDASVTADLLRVGAALDMSITADQFTHWIVARPEYLSNQKENSGVASVNLTYMPVINGTLNDYRYVIASNNHFASFRPILDLRLNAGKFTRRGFRTVAESRDYVRAGGQIGISLSSDIIPFPADLTVTETYLPALNREPRDLHYFKSVLSLGVDKDRIFGVDISYIDGRREELLDKERSWTISFGFKY